MVAGVIFMGSVGALLVVSRDSGDVSNSPANAATLSLQSQALADLVVGSPGFHLAGTTFVEGWDTANADELGRLGLRSTDSPMMDFDKFQNLRRAGYASANDGLVNYPDARTSLGLDGAGLDFHLRAFPSLQSVRDLLANGERDPNLRVTYIGDAEQSSKAADNTQLAGDAGLTVGNAVCSVRADGKAYTISNVLTNGGGATTQLRAIYKVDLLDDGSFAPIEDRTRTYLLPVGTSVTVSVDVAHKSGRSCAGGNVQLELWDNDVRLGNMRQWHMAGSAASTAVANDFQVNPTKTYFVVGDAVKIEIGGDLPTKGSDDITISYRVSTAAGTETLGWQTVTIKGSERTLTLPALAFPVTSTDFIAHVNFVSYKLHQESTTPVGFTVSEPILVVAEADEPGNYVPQGSASTTTVDATSIAIETSFLEKLVDNFCPFFFDSTTSSPLAGMDHATRCAFKSSAPILSPAQPGDVFRDLKSDLDGSLPNRLLGDTPMAPADRKCQGQVAYKPTYDTVSVLVVGSNVAHNSMTSADAKYALCEWVLGGGTLIVFGSASQQVQWLQPVFHAAITSSSTGVSTPDQSHPILNRADALAYDGYDTNGQVWSFNGQTAANQANLLTNVVAAGADTTLSISNPGAFGEGTVILTTWLPYNLFGESPPYSAGAELEGLKLVNNFLMQGYRDLFLDYGPAIPSSGRQAAAAQRVVDIIHPEFTNPLIGGTCSNPQLIAYDAGIPKACYNPITLTLFVYVF